MIELIPTVVPNSIGDVETLLARCREFSHTFHIDAADGTLAPNVTWIPEGSQKLPEADSFFFEAHLMVAHPEAAGSAFAAAGAKRIIAHAEVLNSEEEAKRIFAAWRANGALQIAVALAVETKLEALDPYLLLCDAVTLMSIPRIGEQGIPFDERAYGRVADLHARYPDLIIEVDGGVGEEHLAALIHAGAKRFTEGSTIAKAADPAAEYQKLRSIAESAIQ